MKQKRGAASGCEAAFSRPGHRGIFQLAKSLFEETIYQGLLFQASQ